MCTTQTAAGLYFFTFKTRSLYEMHKVLFVAIYKFYNTTIEFRYHRSCLEGI